jgi:hypothetical protein
MSIDRRRPSSLRDVSRRVVENGEKFDPAVREFLDAFYANATLRKAAIRDRPMNIGRVEDAYIAAVAEHLALSFGLDVPEWTHDHGNGLDRPFFAGNLESLKATLLVESPTAFRRRLLFISKDALSRPRMQQAEEVAGPVEAAMLRPN